MLYIFDLGNVIVEIDFQRVIGVWSNLSGIPLAVLRDRFRMGEVFQQHERGKISDEAFAEQMSAEMGMSLSFEQFSLGWQAVFMDIRPETIDIMHRLHQQGHRVVLLSNTNALHAHYWLKRFPEVTQAVQRLYLSHELGMRKPDAEIFWRVLREEQTAPQDALFFDDHLDNVEAARAVGITSVWVENRQTIPAYFA